ncbi:hypothetical protein PIB30_099624 [Stylosanthes scabra]|uniref:Uncharacterized protein n=1 Tax=Stylosanthes scabra TaxID=79078 RepID=A0ABU6ZW86_9FABA|nr:hypothetical protein [Stylosanthes scabra]
MRGHPRLCMGLHNLGWASTSSTHMLASTHIRGSWKTWTLSLPSTHMLDILCICVALDWASKDGVTFSSSNVCELADPPRICVVFYAYECKGWAWSPRLSVTELLRRGFDLM